jgi:hypothetical protein
MQSGTDGNVVQELRGELHRAETESKEIIDVDFRVVYVREHERELCVSE